MATVTRDTLDDGVRALAERLASRLGDTFVKTAVGGASRRTGEMAAATMADAPAVSGDVVIVHVHCDSDHGRFQDEGTGIYGPTGQRITARPGGVLAFDWPAAGGMVFAHSVAGSAPTRWWSNAVNAWGQIVATVGIGG